MIFLLENINSFDSKEFEQEFELCDNRTRKRVLKSVPLKQKQTLAGRILLRRAVKAEFGIERFSLNYNSQGKPLCDFCFLSISHSAEYVICVVSNNPVGIDIEYVRNIKKRSRYPLFTEYETELVNKACDSSAKFTELWTQKEAYIKLKGESVFKYGVTDIKDLNDVKFTTVRKENYIYSICEYL